MSQSIEEQSNFFTCAQELLASKKFTKAVEVLDNILDEDPDNLDALKAVSVCLGKSNCVLQQDVVKDRIKYIEGGGNGEMPGGNPYQLPRDKIIAPQYRYKKV